MHLVDGHPVLEDLSKANLTIEQLNHLGGSLNARASGLDHRIYYMKDLNEYAQKSLLPILLCINELVSGKTGQIDQFSQLGEAQVVIRRLKGLGKALITNDSQAEQFIPVELLGITGMNGSKLVESMKMSNGNSIELAEIVQKMVSQSHSNLNNPNNSDNNHLLKLSKYCSLRYFNTLKKYNYNIMNPKVKLIGSQRDGFLPLNLYFKSLLF